MTLPASENSGPNHVTRRGMLVGATCAAAGLAAASTGIWSPMKASVFIARNQRYDAMLTQTIRDGLIEAGLQPTHVRGKRVLLKPNLVEPNRNTPHMTTHPVVVASAAEVFLSWGADVVVGEGPGHVRDTEMALVEGGMQNTLDAVGLRFADLNYEEVQWMENQGRASSLPGLFFPRSVVEADLIVSMPKMKTHHWVGVTASMKNLYGVIPGIKYGWPKNVLHHHGIPQTVFDINASLPKTISIVDAIDCMEGDGPIMGTQRKMGLILIGMNPAAVDATACRLMNVDPRQISYLTLAENRLGPISDAHIRQVGEAWRPLMQTFHILDVPHLQNLRGSLVS